jgi:hypothetical protein
MCSTADGAYFNVVDVYNVTTGTWSTAQLSVARSELAATSVGNVALFAGGGSAGALFCREGGRGGVYCCVRVLRVLQYCGSVCPATTSSLMRATAGGVDSNAVDVYNVTTGTWSTAQLSVGRANLAATSVGNVALFAGGGDDGALLCMEGGICLLLHTCWGLRLLLCACFVFCACCDIAVSVSQNLRPLPLA